MKTFYAWEKAPFADRLNVYDNYVYKCREEHANTCMDFEEFDQINYGRSFYYVASVYA